MSKNVTEIPYTEIVERVMSLGRINFNAIEKVRGIVQDIYIRDIPTKHDWNFLMASSSITTTGEYATGNVSATTGSNILTFSSDAVLIDSMNGRKVKLASNEVTYEVDSIGTGVVRIIPTFLGASNITNGSYSMFQPVYALAGDFDRFPKDGGIYKWSGQSKESLREEPYQEYTQNYTSNPSTPSKVRLIGIDSAGNQLVEFRPAPKDARVYSYDYYRKLSPMAETSAGHISVINAKATSVMGYTTTHFVDAGTNSKTINFFRIDVFGKGQDSAWYPALTITDDSSLTLRVAFANSAVTTSANYVVSNVPQIPTMLHPAILYGSLAHILADQNDDMAPMYMARYAQVLSDAKRIYVTRTYSQDIHGVQEDWQYRR